MKPFEVLFLGTSATTPTKERNHTSLLIKYAGSRFLFDCGEGTQRQLRIAEENPAKISKILLSHWHGDHSIGLIGMLHNFGLHNRREPIEFYGPRGSIEKLKALIHTYRINLPFEFKIKEVSPATKPEKICETEDLEIFTFKVFHSIPCNAYIIKEKDRFRIDMNKVKKLKVKLELLKHLQVGKSVKQDGKTIKPQQVGSLVHGRILSLLTDTVFIKELSKPVKDSDLLIIESTFAEDNKDKAKAYKHLTAKQAATIAKLAKAKQAYLTHFSQRYKDNSILLKEAKEVYQNVNLAKDFLSVSVE